MFKSMRLASSSIVLAALWLGAPQGAPGQVTRPISTPIGLQLLHKMQAALGGADKIAAIHDYEEKVRAKIWNSNGTPMGEVRKRTRWLRSPNLLRVDQIGPRDTYVLYFDSSSGSGWEMLPDLENPDPFKTTGKPIKLAGSELKFAKNYLLGFSLSMWLADRISGYTVTSPAPNVLRIERDGNATDFTLDPSTWLPLRTSEVSLSNPDRPVVAEMHYEAWTEVAGVRFPTTRANYHHGVKLAEETTEAAIHVNLGLLPQQLAAPPANLAPEIPADDGRSRSSNRASTHVGN